MNSRDVVVRIVQPAAEPTLHHPAIAPLLPETPRQNNLLVRTLNIIGGSLIGLAAGVAIYLALKLTGLDTGTLGSTLIVGFPAACGLLTSIVVY